jgi:hypothetical protein
MVEVILLFDLYISRYRSMEDKGLMDLEVGSQITLISGVSLMAIAIALIIKAFMSKDSCCPGNSEKKKD